jgi:hypothetical protein
MRSDTPEAATVAAFTKQCPRSGRQKIRVPTRGLFKPAITAGPSTGEARRIG